MTSSRENVSYPQSSDGTRTKVMHKGYFHSHTCSNNCGNFMLILHFSKTKKRNCVVNHFRTGKYLTLVNDRKTQLSCEISNLYHENNSGTILKNTKLLKKGSM